MVIIVAGTGILFTIIFHVGVKEHSRDCCAQLATRSSKRSAANWTAWFREPLFYQVHMLSSSVLILSGKIGFESNGKVSMNKVY